jgi:hypothetical protein
MPRRSPQSRNFSSTPTHRDKTASLVVRSRLIGNAKPTEGNWPEVMAEVTECHYDVRAGEALAFGLTSEKHFRITYTYRVGDELREGECFSEVARPQGSLFPIQYDPASTDLRHSNTQARPFSRVILGVAGSIALSVIVLLYLRGC